MIYIKLVQCIYTSEWLPCLFCQTRNISCPCLKLPGPKTASRLPLSRQIPTQIDATIAAEDVLLLQYAYSVKDLRTATYFKQLALVYGTAISHRSLRHAILAYAASELPPDTFRQKMEYHKSRVCGILIQKLNRPENICDADVFATCVLAWTAWWFWSGSEFLAHAKGCLSMLAFLSESSKERPLSDMLIVFGPYVMDGLDFLFSRDGAYIPRFPDQRTMFREHFRYCQVFSRTGAPVDTWQFPAMRALRVTFDHRLKGAAWWLRHAAIKELEGDSQTVMSIARRVVSAINEDLSDLDLQRAICEVIEQSHDVKNGTFKDVLKKWAWIHWQCIQLVLAIFDAPTILQGFDSLPAITSARKVVSAWSFQGKPRGPRIEDSYCTQIVLAGLALGMEDLAERNHVDL